MDIVKKIIQEENQKILQLTFENIEIVDFQINMINTHKNAGLLQLEKNVFNNYTHLRYFITGYESISEYIANNEIDSNEFKDILKSISKTINQSKELLLENNNFVLDLDMVYINPKNLEVKLINIPTLQVDDLNINDKYINLVSQLITTLMMTSKIKDGSAEFILQINKFISNQNISISDIVENLDKFTINQDIEKSKSEIKTQPKPEPVVKTESKPEVKPVQPKPVQKTTPTPKQVQPKTVQKTTPVQTRTHKKEDNKNDVEKTQTIEKYRYKTSNIIIAIVLQPILLAMILCISILPGVGMVELLGGAGAILAIDALVLKNLLDPKKKQKVKMVVKTNNTQKQANNKQSDSKKKAKQDKKTTTASSAKKQIKVPAPNNDATEYLDDATEYLDDETSFLGAGAYVQNNNGETIDIDSDEFIIGRQAKLQEWITVKNIGRNHAKISKVNGKYFIQDLDSKNGTSLNLGRLNPNEPAELNEGDIITISELSITFRLY